MRLLRLGFCVLLMASFVAAQDSAAGNQNPTSTDPATTQATGQQPASPLAEPQKPSEAQQNKPKSPTFDLSGVTTGQDQEVGEIRLMTRATEVGGDKTRSFRIDGQ